MKFFASIFRQSRQSRQSRPSINNNGMIHGICFSHSKENVFWIVKRKKFFAVHFFCPWWRAHLFGNTLREGHVIGDHWKASNSVKRLTGTRPDTHLSVGFSPECGTTHGFQRKHRPGYPAELFCNWPLHWLVFRSLGEVWIF